MTDIKEKNTLKENLKNNIPTLILAAAAFVLILTFAIIYREHPINVLPLFISLAVMFLQACVSRYTFLVGAINSLIYAIPYIGMGLYVSAAASVLMSAPFQLLAFLRWGKNTKGGETEIRSLSWRGRGVVVGVFVAVWLLIYLIFGAIGAGYLVLDNTTNVISIVQSVLSVLRYFEYTVLQVFYCIFQFATFVAVVGDDPAKMTYLVYSVYSAFCVGLSLCRMSRRARLAKISQEAAAKSK